MVVVLAIICESWWVPVIGLELRIAHLRLRG
jgi:hypothetical protein